MSTSAPSIPVKTGQPVLMARIRTDARASQAILDNAVKLDKMFVRQITPVQMAQSADRDILTTFTALVVPDGSAKSATKDRVSQNSKVSKLFSTIK